MGFRSIRLPPWQLGETRERVLGIQPPPGQKKEVAASCIPSELTSSASEARRQQCGEFGRLGHSSRWRKSARGVEDEEAGRSSSFQRRQIDRCGDSSCGSMPSSPVIAGRETRYGHDAGNDGRPGRAAGMCRRAADGLHSDGAQLPCRPFAAAGACDDNIGIEPDHLAGSWITHGGDVAPSRGVKRCVRLRLPVANSIARRRATWWATSRPRDGLLRVMPG